jgi:uncharacterized membrane protein HdeD (DUF308 family)
MTRRPNIASLVSGLALLALGILLVLDAQGTLDLGFAYVGPALLAIVGATLLASGLSSRRRD